MSLCQVCRNEALFDHRQQDKPRLDDGERCHKCNRTADMEKEDLEVDVP